MSKILLVEDDNNLREIYEARLQAEGFEISSAHDGEEALIVAKDQHPDLIISDVMMPKISGFEMLDIIRSTPTLSNVKIIMLTALGQSDDRDRADKLGADRYLVKSQVTLEDIVKASHELLDNLPDNPTINNSDGLTPDSMNQDQNNQVVQQPMQPEPVSNDDFNKEIINHANTELGNQTNNDKEDTQTLTPPSFNQQTGGQRVIYPINNNTDNNTMNES
jgi:DNA-binding response OmpR family regulator